jgi:hypothetical protein
MVSSLQSDDRRALRFPPASVRSPAAAPRPAALALKLALAVALAATLVLGAVRPVPLLLRLLEAFLIALAGLSLAVALGRRETPRLGAYSHWHEAAALGLIGLASHLALIALR